MTYLYQNQYWETKDGRVLKVEDIEPDHRDNLIAWLERNANKLASDFIWDRLPFPNMRGDMAQLHAEEEWDREMRFAIKSPVEWVRNTPLYRKLNELKG